MPPLVVVFAYQGKNADVMIFFYFDTETANSKIVCKACETLNLLNNGVKIEVYLCGLYSQISPVLLFIPTKYRQVIEKILFSLSSSRNPHNLPMILSQPET